LKSRKKDKIIPPLKSLSGEGKQYGAQSKWQPQAKKQAWGQKKKFCSDCLSMLESLQPSTGRVCELLTNKQKLVGRALIAINKQIEVVWLGFIALNKQRKKDRLSLTASINWF